MVGQNALAHDFCGNLVSMYMYSTYDVMYVHTYKEPPSTSLLAQAPLAYGDIILMLPPNRGTNVLGGAIYVAFLPKWLL